MDGPRAARQGERIEAGRRMADWRGYAEFVMDASDSPHLRAVGCPPCMLQRGGPGPKMRLQFARVPVFRRDSSAPSTDSSASPHAGVILRHHSEPARVTRGHRQ